MININYSRIYAYFRSGPRLGSMYICKPQLSFSPPNTEYSRFPCFHCYMLGGAIMHILNESRKCRSKTETRKMHKLIISYVSI